MSTTMKTKANRKVPLKAEGGGFCLKKDKLSHSRLLKNNPSNKNKPFEKYFICT